MNNPAVALYCSDAKCQAANDLNHKFCQACSTPLLRRYLWMIGGDVRDVAQGTLLEERYQVCQARIVLDTKPAESPTPPEDIPEAIAPYLKLIPYRLHLPQVYGIISLANRPTPTWLLEYGTLPNAPDFSTGHILPSLLQQWPHATAVRQLNWLWQIAQLWEPLENQGVVSSLLSPALIRVQGQILKLAELQGDTRRENPEIPTLSHLGQLWLTWQPLASPLIRKFIQQLAEALQNGKISDSHQLIYVLDQAIAQATQARQQEHHLSTATDAGPSRSHNEDACYPPHNTRQSLAQGENSLAIVCDGIGGHDGGEIASQLAIEALQQSVQPLLAEPPAQSPEIITELLETAISRANDLISQRNDSEQRQMRKRMGTTLVMTLSHQHQMFCAHVGDSRIYWITRSGCHQLTLDDDIASREVRLGYALYLDAVSYPNAGALVQALGMSASTRLYPNVGRVIIDEDSVFLLCSDGLSDDDRVDQYWATEILPILTEKRDLKTVTDRLMEIGQTKNGHDNITIALVHCQVQAKPATGSNLITLPPLHELPAPSIYHKTQTPAPLDEPTEPMLKLKPRLNWVQRSLLAGGILLGLVLALGSLSWFMFPEMRQQADRLLGNSPARPPVASPPPISPPTTLPQPTQSITEVSLNQWVVFERSVELYPSPEVVSNPQTIPPQTPLQIRSRSTRGEQVTWIQFRHCLPSPREEGINPEETTPPSPGITSPDSPMPPNEGELEEEFKVGWMRVDLTREAQMLLVTVVAPVTDCLPE
ncbi:protein phosphatase 2C domain-containing protein [Spirulina subsalsa FACHB-351]|uniref:Protein phosphatase 2C domain-containing protein n=1 Tax=Spirulina subsalsa FACHB-351 TaxID=234711 RepID=A0ABT3L4W7_9CYAN|nr:protein phosphatase 2C domain-containing protein [Spirulina subsalsa]MCW6036556.1 protein phosphatase 2C domain-containing protein [Spirulina subsalsa FACHB-351]